MIQKIGPVNLKGKVYDSLKKYILSLNIYLKQSDFHLDERQLLLKQFQEEAYLCTENQKKN